MTTAVIAGPASVSAEAGAPAFAEVEARIDAIAERAARGGVTGGVAAAAAGELLGLGESVLEAWARARGETPTQETREGFRILALHRQGAKGEPSFNACRETVRELVYHYNLVTLEPDHPETARRLALMSMVARHLVLFVGGKLEVAGLGEFCCASRPIRT